MTIPLACYQPILIDAPVTRPEKAPQSVGNSQT
jgi:hypothetical protein